MPIDSNVSYTADFSFTSPASATTTAQTPVTGLGGFRSVAIYANIQGGTGGTLDLTIQFSPDGGTTWVDYARFAQLAAGAAAIHRVWMFSKDQPRPTVLGDAAGAGVIVGPATIGVGTSPAITAASAIGGEWGDRLRIVAVAGAGTSAGAAQNIKAIFSK